MRYWKSRNIGREPKVGIVVAYYHKQDWASFALIASLLAQTYKKLNIYLVHDGPLPAGTALPGNLRPWESIGFNGKYFTVLESGSDRLNVFGHNSREVGRKRALEDGCEVIGFTNGDNYYVPVFVESLVSAMEWGPKPDIAYCNCIHSHKEWLRMDTHMKRGQIDVGCWLARRTLVEKVAWDEKKYVFHGDWLYLAEMLEQKPGIAKLPGYLMTHN